MNALKSVWTRLSTRLWDRPGASPEQRRTRAFAILFWVSAVVALGNTGMQSVLPAIGRQIGIPDPMVAAIFSLSALLWALSSPYWARLSDRFGRKPLILLGLGGFMVSMICCGWVVSLGLAHWAAPAVIFVLFLLARALFGLFGSATPPATQAYVAERTTREQRTQAMSTLAGAFGLGTIVGPLAATLFVLPVVGLAGPMFAFAAIAGLMFLVVVKLLPETPGAPGALSADQARLVPAEAEARVLAKAQRPRIWRDRRLTAFLVYGFVSAMCQNALGQTLGFLIIDKVHQTPVDALDYIRTAMMSGAVASPFGAVGPDPHVRHEPPPPAAVGRRLGGGRRVVDRGVAGLLDAGHRYTLSSLGFAFARPGFTAAPR